MSIARAISHTRTRNFVRYSTPNNREREEASRPRPAFTCSRDLEAIQSSIDGALAFGFDKYADRSKPTTIFDAKLYVAF